VDVIFQILSGMFINHTGYHMPVVVFAGAT
jgi:hypothetical protein